tara:strand:+ start:245 stop:553 length:309 start_codon:yes stop_codon:yes gene_type:complete
MRKLTKGQSAFYNEPDSKIVVNIPCKILRVKRIYCTVLLFEDENSLNGCEVWEVPKEDLVPTDSFYVEGKDPFIGQCLISTKTNKWVSPKELREEIKGRIYS